MVSSLENQAFDTQIILYAKIASVIHFVIGGLPMIVTYKLH